MLWDCCVGFQIMLEKVTSEFRLMFSVCFSMYWWDNEIPSVYWTPKHSTVICNTNRTVQLWKNVLSYLCDDLNVNSRNTVFK